MKMEDELLESTAAAAEAAESSAEDEESRRKKEERKLYSPCPLTRETGTPGVLLDFNSGLRMRFPAEEGYHMRVTDRDAMIVLSDADVSSGFAFSKEKYYVNYLVELWKDGTKILTHALDLKGKNVKIVFPVAGVLGDILAWFPYAEAFRQKHGCNVYCMVREEHAGIFRPAYPEMRFVAPGESPPDCYATYYMGAYSDKKYSPVEHNLAGLSGCIPYILGLERKELRPVLTPCRERLIPEPYVCIGAQSTAQRKYWNNPRGWDVTVEYLKSLGYRVLCIDRKSADPVDIYPNVMPAGAEDFTGDLPLQQRIDLLGHADFFVGLSSGLSWLAWGAGIPVVLISGFTLPQTEFYTPYRVIQYHSCYGCWNDNRVEILNTDRLYCPRHGGTKRMFECSRFITPEFVCKTIDRLMADYGLDPKRRIEE